MNDAVFVKKIFRQFLQQKKLLMPTEFESTQTGSEGDRFSIQHLRAMLPVSVDAETLHQFVMLGTQPFMHDVKLDWARSLARDPWNQAVIELLARTFRSEIHRGAYPMASLPNDILDYDMAFLIKTCEQKLRRTHEMHRDVLAAEAERNKATNQGARDAVERKLQSDKINSATVNRRNGRRVNVCYLPL